MRFLHEAIIVSIFLLGFSSMVCAETVKLKSGQTVEGKIISQDKTSLRLDVGLQTPITYFLDEIQAISLENPQLTHQANKLESQAIDFIDNDNMDKGIALMARATELDPTPMRRMNYGSILFGNGVEYFKNGDKVEALRALHEAENQLSQAIAAFHPKRDQQFLAQAYFLLGEIYSNAFADPRKARDFYQISLSYYYNQGAKEALETLQ